MDPGTFLFLALVLIACGCCCAGVGSNPEGTTARLLTVATGVLAVGGGGAAIVSGIDFQGGWALPGGALPLLTLLYVFVICGVPGAIVGLIGGWRAGWRLPFCITALVLLALVTVAAIVSRVG